VARRRSGLTSDIRYRLKMARLVGGVPPELQNEYEDAVKMAWKIGFEPYRQLAKSFSRYKRERGLYIPKQYARYIIPALFKCYKERLEGYDVDTCLEIYGKSKGLPQDIVDALKEFLTMLQQPRT